MTQREKIEEILGAFANTSNLSEAITQIETLITEGKIEELERILNAGEGQTWDAQMANAVGEVAKRYKTLQASLKGKEV